MERTTKIQKRVSLSLGNKLQKKRHSESPQGRLRAGVAAATAAIETENATNCANANETNAATRSPSVLSISSECSTPPHRKSVCLDDSVDFSPKLLDNSLSPSCLFSQTMTTDSPEVDWRWNRRRALEAATQKIKCGTSSDSGFNSEENLLKTEEIKSKSSATVEGRERRKLILTCNEKRRAEQEQQMRRAQQTRAHELLQERCEKLHKQLEHVKVRSAEKVAPKPTEEKSSITLRSASTAKMVSTAKTNNKYEVPPKPIADKKTLTLRSAGSTEKLESNAKTNNKNEATAAAMLSKNNEIEKHTNTLDDFFNDSDIDCFILDANVAVTPTKVPAPVAFDKPKATETTAKATKSKSNTLDDFFNDSDSDDFLLEATQQLETQIVTLTTTQQVTNKKAPAAKTNFSTSTKTTTTKPTAVSRQQTQQQEQQSQDKRSSLYMKFLEEETPDEWLTAFDEAVREATQPKKLRTSLQRYKSMPDATTANVNKPASTMINNNNNNNNKIDASATTSVTTPISFKRHASTHALSPVARNKLFGNSK